MAARQALPTASMDVTPVKSTRKRVKSARRMVPCWRDSAICQQSCSTSTHSPFNFPSSRNVTTPGVLWTVIRNIAHALGTKDGSRTDQSVDDLLTCLSPKAEVVPAMRTFSARLLTDDYRRTYGFDRSTW